jgi:hypothetical protein
MLLSAHPLAPSNYGDNSESTKFLKTCSKLVLFTMVQAGTSVLPLQMAPFEALYGRRCRTPLSWSETGERKIFGPDLVVEVEDKVKVIQTNLKAVQSR